MQEGMAALEQLPRIGPDPALEGALPQESEVPPSPMAETPGSTVGAGASAGAQEATKEVVPEGRLAQVGSAVGGGSQAEETVTDGPDVIEVEVVSVSSGEPSDLAKVAQSSRAEGPMALTWVGHDPFQWGGLRLTWSDRIQPEAPLIFMLDDVEDLES
jgi:hypothetical protein